MHEMTRLPLLGGLLLSAVMAMDLARAEGPLVLEPMPPAVAGRPLHQLRPAPQVREQPVVAKRAAQRQAKVARAAVHKPRAAPAVAAQSMGAAALPQGAANARPAKQAVDDRAGAAALPDDVGQGTHFARKRLAPGAYISEKYRSAVHKYFAAHPARGATAKWRIGDPVPRGAAVRDVPAGLRASLPEQPPGLRYLQLGGDVVLVAEGSNMVVDGVSRKP